MRARGWTEEEFKTAVKDSYSIANVLRMIGLVPRGGNYKTVRKEIARLELDTSHFTGQLWSKGRRVGNFGNATPLSEILVENSTYGHNAGIKSRLFANGHFEPKCYNCNLTEWMGGTIPLELEHINGVSNDNRIENLTLLCPNCHALTPTYRGRNKHGGLDKLAKSEGLNPSSKDKNLVAGSNPAAPTK